jgi:putative peptide zinc metalloprotease protein
MGEALLSSSWYRVASVKPRLRGHVQLHRMLYRGALWYLLQDPVSSKVHRFTPAARFVIAAMDGERTVQELWELTNRQLGEDAPSQDEVIRLLGQLHAADLLQSDAMPDASELFERGETQSRSMRQRSYLNPMAIRVHLWDPDRLLNAVRPLIDALWSRWGGILWLVVVVPALLLLPSQWAELTGNFSDRIFAVDNLLLLWLVFPLTKALHEFGHAAAVKRGGGEVHDLGIVMLVMIPIPYVEASASTVFKSKFYRAVVGASGMAVELFIAALAFYVWMVVEPSPFRAMLFNVMTVAGVSTLIFNGNPLLRYDAYYILSDLIEMPNLANRSIRYWGYLIERYVFGVVGAQTLEDSSMEKAWLLVYGVLSTVYRVFVTIAIALFVASGFFFVGVLLAIWAVTMMAIMPVFKTIKHIVVSARLRPHRVRVWTVISGVFLGLAMLLFVLPAPFRTVAEGVAWLPQTSQVRSGQAGFLESFVAAPGSRVEKGDLLLLLKDPALESFMQVSLAKVAELEATYAAAMVADRAQAAIALDQLEVERTALRTARERVAMLSLEAATDGIFLVPKAQDMPGRYFEKGDLLGYVIDKPDLIARVVVGQESVDVVRSATTRVQVRLAHDPSVSLEGRMEREVPSGDEYLPSRVLSVEGGGQLATDPRDAKGSRTLERTFQFDVAVDLNSAESQAIFFGERVHALFVHPAEPLAQQWYRGIRRLFLSYFHV